MENICKLCKYSQICGTGITGEGHTVHTVTVWCAWLMEQKPATNADRIRAMTDNVDLAIFLDAVRIDGMAKGDKYPHSIYDWLDWLKQEVDE